MLKQLGSPRHHTLQAAIALFLVSALAWPVWAQSQPEAAPEPALPTVKTITIQFNGPATLSRDKVLSLLRTRVGQPYSQSIAEQDVKSLFDSGEFANVRIFGQPQGDGVEVIVALQTRSVLHEIRIEGASKISSASLRKKISVKLNAPIDEKKLEEGRQEIITSYKGRGYNDVDVQFRVEPIDEKRGTSRVVYTVNEGAKGAIVAIRFEGNAHIPSTALRKQMKTKTKTILSFVDKSGRWDDTQLQEDLDSVREYYQNHGYADVAVRETRRERTKKGGIQIVIVIDEGQLYHIGKVDYVGYKATTDQKLRALAKVKEGSIYSPKAIKNDAKQIADAYGLGGYVDLNVTPQTEPGKSGTINVTYRIEEGQRSFVQRIIITGNTRTKDKVIRREVLIAPGEIFDTVRVETSKKRLENLGYFSKVDTYPEDTGVEGRKDLEIQVEEKRTGSLNFGAGFSTVDSLLAFVELTQGNFDITNWPALTGGGQKFRMRIQLGTQRKDAEVALTEPWFLDRPMALGGSVFYHEATYYSNDYDQRNYGAFIELRKGLLTNLYGTIGYRYEEIDIYNVVGGVSTAILDQQGNSTKSQVYGNLVWDTRNNPFLTRTGERISLSAYVAGGPLGGNEQVYNLDLLVAKYFHLPHDMILLFNAEAAVVDAWGNSSNVRIYDRLYLGGSNDLRGFDYRTVGPKDKNDQPIGGRSLARATVELTYPIIEKVRGAIFYDAGFVNADPYDFGTNNLASDIGIGVRLDLPIGPLRIDYGFPVQHNGNNQKDSNSGKFNFNVGYQF